MQRVLLLLLLIMIYLCLDREVEPPRLQPAQVSTLAAEPGDLSP